VTRRFKAERRCRLSRVRYVPGVNWQTVISLLIVVLAAAGLLWRMLRRRKFRFQRDSPCGCATPARGGAGDSMVFRVRKGERAQIIVKNK
jgi:hypothetical protein